MRFVLCVAMAWCAALSAAAQDWSQYGGDLGGQRYSGAAQITPENVRNLTKVWEFKTGDLAARSAYARKRMKFQATPVLYGDSLYTCSPFNEIFALDPGTGALKWRFDPKIQIEKFWPANKFNCRGVAVWEDLQATQDAACRLRVFTGTNDGRLAAVDGKTGAPCADFGDKGQVKIDPGMPLDWPGEFQITSAPLIVNDIVVVGSAISDNGRVAAPHGTVRAFDARSGALRWTWDPVPRTAEAAAAQGWTDGWQAAGHANVWAPMSADAARGLIFLPTSSPSPDFFGGLRPGDNRHANSVVALKAASGELFWAYQIVHHDVWDYDTPAQPTLTTLQLDAGPRDVVIQGTKQGFVFVLDRDTGKPVFPVEERPVPQGGAPGEALSPTQPFPAHVPALVPQHLKPEMAWGLTPWDRGECRAMIEAARSDGLYTPPSEKGTILFPFTGGGVNWGGVSFDPHRQILYANTTRMAHLITLFPAAKFDELDKKFPDKEVSPQKGAPFGMIRDTLLSPLGLPCNPPPWGTIAAVDLKAGKLLWEKPLGTTEELAPLGIAMGWGTPNLGAPVATAGGVVFIGAAMDKYLRAFNAATGKELWAGRLPSTAQATPMIYEWQGRQFVVIGAGGYPDLDMPPGDSFVAFALPKPGESGPSLWARTVDQPGGRFAAICISAFLFLVCVIAYWRWFRTVRFW
jgi:quinoprotein glucose dehydrogenase